MTDKEKLDKLVAEIERRKKEHEEKKYNYASTDYFWRAVECKELLSFYNSMQKEPVSEDLEEEIGKYCSNPENFITYLDVGFMQSPIEKDDIPLIIKAIKFGANWQKNNLLKPADGDDLPEYDREVIAILDYDFGHYKVVYAHRPNPNGWNGTNIDTGEKEHFEPEIYDKGGWNQPHVLYWLDTILPCEEK